MNTEINPLQLLALPLYLLALPILVLTSIMSSIQLPNLPLPGGTYSNEESWSIKRGADGRISDIVIHRLAQER